MLYPTGFLDQHTGLHHTYRGLDFASLAYALAISCSWPTAAELSVQFPGLLGVAHSGSSASTFLWLSNTIDHHTPASSATPVECSSYSITIQLWEPQLGGHPGTPLYPTSNSSHVLSLQA